MQAKRGVTRYFAPSSDFADVPLRMEKIPNKILLLIEIEAVGLSAQLVRVSAYNPIKAVITEAILLEPPYLTKDSMMILQCYADLISCQQRS